MSDKKKILVVEDDQNMGFLLKEFLANNGFDVTHALDGNAGLAEFEKEEFDLCLLDVMMPGLDGYSLAQNIRTKRNVPFIFLTARSMKEDKIRGFNLGCDDYITKPFDEEELLCRIHAVLNRYNPEDSFRVAVAPSYRLGDYVFDTQNYALIYKEDNLTRLTHRESDLLTMLCTNMGVLVKRNDLLVSFWGQADYFNGRSLDVFITRLRKLLIEDPKVKIETVPKVGYILTAE